jgi:CRISPR/Cas system CSM-associated protein Csm4 (group 5 of RAMP superfamily)
MSLMMTTKQTEKNTQQAIDLLQDEYLGGQGSRGYGG